MCLQSQWPHSEMPQKPKRPLPKCPHQNFTLAEFNSTIFTNPSGIKQNYFHDPFMLGWHAFCTQKKREGANLLCHEQERGFLAAVDTKDWEVIGIPFDIVFFWVDKGSMCQSGCPWIYPYLWVYRWLWKSRQPGSRGFRVYLDFLGTWRQHYFRSTSPQPPSSPRQIDNGGNRYIWSRYRQWAIPESGLFEWRWICMANAGQG